MIYIITLVFMQYVATPTDSSGRNYQVSSYEACEDKVFHSRDEAMQQYAKLRALQPYNNYVQVKMDSFNLCKSATK